MANDYGERFFEIGTSVAEKFAARMAELTKSEALFSHLRDRGFTASDQNAFDYGMITFFFFCKTYKTYQAIRMLCRGGFVEDALVLGRTIFAWLASKKPELQKDYVQTYALQSGIVHSSPTCVNEYLRWSEAAEAGWQMNCHPDYRKESHFNLVAIDSTRWLLGILAILNGAWDLQMQTDLDSGLERCRSSLHDGA